MFSGAELAEFVQQRRRTSRSTTTRARCWRRRPAASSRRSRKGVKALVCTLGAKGSLIFAGGERHEMPSVEAEAVVDPTGCGDAYRAGLLYGIAHGWDWPSDRPPRLGDGRDQDRAARRAEPPALARRHRGALPARLRLLALEGVKRRASAGARGSSPRRPRACRAAGSSPAR